MRTAGTWAIADHWRLTRPQHTHCGSLYIRFTHELRNPGHGWALMKPTFTTIALLTSSLLIPSAIAHREAAPQPKVQLALLLDTSNSMDGLIEQAKTQLWKVVNTFIESKKDGKVPFVEVALYEYGNQGLKPGQNFIRQVQPFTRDLDQVSADLFALKTNGGDEYCGAVIERAVQDLKWDASGQVYKSIFIAGNEPFTQGSVSPNTACKEAIGRGVVVNTIHCGPNDVGLSGGWHQGAQLAEGTYMVINQDAVVAHVNAPQDKEILRLNKCLNETYIPFGAVGAEKKQSQIVQDSNARSKASAGADVQRALTKASSNYWNATWDLADRSLEKDFDWSKVGDAQLPEAMRGLDLDGRKKYVADKIVERQQIQTEIKKLNKARVAYVAEKRQESSTETAQTLDKVVTKTVREQATKKGYLFGKN